VKRAFFARPVLEVARDLVGCVVTHGDTAGIIVETEAYHESEAACHAYVGVTPRTEVLFGPPGRAYVYFSYGMHWMLNAVSEPAGVGAAVLIRALEPVDGLDHMRERRGMQAARQLCSGPGKLTQALGIGPELNDTDLLRGPVRFSDRPRAWRDVAIDADVRVGITKAADLPWRFLAAGNRYVSRPVRRVAAA
jgi:DNA-3-methyladenine glycosylase